MRSTINQLFIICLVLILSMSNVGSQRALAMNAKQASTKAPDMIPETVTTPLLQATISQELQDIPQGFYGILDVNELKAKIDQEPTVLVDVRQPAEYRSGHLPGAINIPLRSLADHLTQIPTDQPVILYCSTGYRTGIGVMALHLLGYENVMGFPPSYEGWKQAQLD